MSALNVFRTAEAVHLFVDSAILDLSKGLAVGGFGSKVFPLSHQNAVLSCTGQVWLAPLFAQAFAFDCVDSFDGLVAKVSKLVVAALARDTQQPNAMKPGRFEMVVAGISEATGEPTAFLLRNYDHGQTKAFQIYQINKMIWPELPHGDFDESIGLRVLQRQREAPCAVQDIDTPAYIIGGEAVHVTISKAGVCYKTIWRWGDPVGQPIRPKLNPVIG